MASRGPYKKGVAKRAEILDTALEVIQRNGYSNATVKELADAVGLSQNGLLHYFGSKDQLFIDVLRHRDELLIAQIGDDPHGLVDDLERRIVAAANETAAAPGLLQLTLGVGIDATDPGHVAHEFIRERYAGARAVSAAAIAELQATGRVAPDVHPAIAGALLNAALDGLQVQWSYDPSIDMGSHMTYLVRALGLSDRDAAAAPVDPEP